MDLFDTILRLPMRQRGLPDLSLGDGLVPDHGGHGVWLWLSALSGRARPWSEDTVSVQLRALLDRGLTLEGYLQEQRRRLCEAYPAMIPVRLYLRGPNRKNGRYIRALVGLPRADMGRFEKLGYIRDLMAKIMARDNMRDCEARVSIIRGLDGPRVKEPPTVRDPATSRFVPPPQTPPTVLCADHRRHRKPTHLCIRIDRQVVKLRSCDRLAISLYLRTVRNQPSAFSASLI